MPVDAHPLPAQVCVVVPNMLRDLDDFPHCTSADSIRTGSIPLATARPLVLFASAVSDVSKGGRVQPAGQSAVDRMVDITGRVAARREGGRTRGAFAGTLANLGELY